MRLTETIAAVVIFSLVFASFSATTARMLPSLRKMAERQRNAAAALSFDAKLRAKIAGFGVPHWQNPDALSSALRDEIFSECGGAVISCEKVFNSRGIAAGMRVRWRLGGKEYESVEAFGSRCAFGI